MRRAPSFHKRIVPSSPRAMHEYSVEAWSRLVMKLTAAWAAPTMDGSKRVLGMAHLSCNTRAVFVAVDRLWHQFEKCSYHLWIEVCACERSNVLARFSF